MAKMRRNRTETTENYQERIRARDAVGHVLFYKDLLSIEEYIKILEDNNLDYIHVEFETTNGSRCKLVIPACNLKAMSSRQINTLFRGMK